jgi:AraC-like DNA-binding protein
LAAIVEAVWTLEAPPAAAVGPPQPVIPDGRAEIIVHFGDAFERWDGGAGAAAHPSVVRQPSVIFAGQLDAPLRLRPTGTVGVLGIRLRPNGAAALCRVPQCELVGETIAAADVSAPLADWLEQVRDAARTPTAAASMVCAGLERLVQRDAIDARVTRAIHLVERQVTGITVAELASAVNLTSRQLERLFAAEVGLSPRTYLRVRRFQAALRALESSHLARSPRPGTDAAHRGGYADQSHFVREFRALAGSTPTAHLMQQAELTGVFRRIEGGPGLY